MTRTKAPRHRMNLALADDTYRRLERLQKQTGSESATATIRYALWIAEQAVDAINQGGRIELIDPDGKRTGLRFPVA